MLGILKMDCPHEKLEEMYGISFCVECGEEISVTIGEMKGGFYKHGRRPKEKMTQDDELQKNMFRYKFPYDVTVEAIKLYRHYLTVTGEVMKGNVRKTIAFGCSHVAIMTVLGSVDESKLLGVIGLQEKSGQRRLAQVTATLDTMEDVPDERMGDVSEETMEDVQEEVIEGDYPDGGEDVPDETMEDVQEEVIEGDHPGASEGEED